MLIELQTVLIQENNEATCPHAHKSKDLRQRQHQENAQEFRICITGELKVKIYLDN
jgi:hypothetical protein